MNNNYFPQYTTDYISGVMSLRKPQTASLKILEEIVNSVSLRKGMNLKAALGAVHAMYPICSDFEREFMSLTFALATGVGKTRLMGAFIAYLYTQHNIKNFFVVAPNTTIYEKLKRDLSDWNSSKYVFKGLGCFSTPPQIITDDDYRTKNLEIFDSEVHIFVFNIDKPVIAEFFERFECGSAVDPALADQCRPVISAITHQTPTLFSMVNNIPIFEMNMFYICKTAFKTCYLIFAGSGIAVVKGQFERRNHCF